MSCSNIVKAVTVRVVLLLHNLLSVWRVTVVWDNHLLWLLVLANVPFIAEGFYTVIKKKGIEWKWLCPCFLFFLMSTLPAIWLLEINRQGTYVSINTTAIADLAVGGVKIPIRLNADTWVLIIEECLLYFMILGRWFLPRGEVSREQLSQLLFSYLAIASDIMELFSLFDEDVIRSDILITYILLAVWTLSILQFTLVLTVYNRPRRARVTQKATLEQGQKDAVKLEIVAIFISMLMQDGPFLCLRLYCLIQLQLVTYSVVFFTAKNLLVILLLVYRLCILCINNYCGGEPESEKYIHEKSSVGDFHGGDFEFIDLGTMNGSYEGGTAVVFDKRPYDGSANGGVVRQRPRSELEPMEITDKRRQCVSTSSLRDKDVPTLSIQDSNVCSDSVVSTTTDVEMLTEPAVKSDHVSRRNSLDSVRL